MKDIELELIRIKYNGIMYDCVEAGMLWYASVAVGGNNKKIKDGNGYVHPAGWTNNFIKRNDKYQILSTVFNIPEKIENELFDWLNDHEWIKRNDIDQRGMFLYSYDTAKALLKKWAPKHQIHICDHTPVFEIPSTSLYWGTLKKQSLYSIPNKKEVSFGEPITPQEITAQEFKNEPTTRNKELIRDQITEDFIDRITYIINAYYAVNCGIGGKRTVNQRIEAFIKSYVAIDKKEQVFVRWVLKEYYKHMKDNEYYGKTRN